MSQDSTAATVEQAFAENRRLTLHCDLLHASEELVSASPVDWLSRAHLTVLHYGKIADLVRELVDLTGKDSASLVRDLIGMLERAVRLAPPSNARARGYEVLTSGDSSWLVLSIDPGDTLARARHASRQMLLNFLGEEGLVDPEAFMNTSRAIQQISRNWTPHITIQAIDSNGRELPGLPGNQIVELSELRV